MSKDQTQYTKESNERRGIKRVPLDEDASSKLTEHKLKWSLANLSDAIRHLFDNTKPPEPPLKRKKGKPKLKKKTNP